MKKMQTLLFALAALAGTALIELTPGVSNAQAPTQIKTKASTGVFSDAVRAKKVDSITPKPIDLSNAKKVPTGLGIARFDAERDSRDIDITGAIENISFQPITGISYSISKLTGSGWKQIKTGSNITVKPRKTFYVFASDTATNALVGYKFEISSPGQKDAKNFSLKEKKLTYLVKYETKGNWVLARYFPRASPPPNQLAGRNATNFKNSLRDNLGFATKTKLRRHEHLFADWEWEFWVYVQTTTPLQRTFDNWRSAVEFRDHVRSQVPDQGLTVEILEK